MTIDLLEKDRVNIKNLVLPEPNQRAFGLPFNPDRDITVKDQVEIEKHLEERMNGMLFQQRLEGGMLPLATDFFEYYLAAKTLRPQITEKLPFGEQTWAAVNKRLERSKINESPEYFHLAALLKTTFPGHKIVGDEDRHKLELGLSDWFLGGQNQRYLRGIWDYKILFTPDFPRLHLNNQVWPELEKYLKSLDLVDLVESAALFKMAYPEYFTTLQTGVEELQMSDKRWEILKSNLIDFHRKSNSWEMFTTNALNLTILAAEDVQITDKGLEISMPKPLITEPKPNLPQRRKF